MRLCLPLALILLPAVAQAHPGHLADLAGHDHWVAGAAIGAAVLAGLWGALKGKGRSDPDEPADDDDEEVPA